LELFAGFGDFDNSLRCDKGLGTRLGDTDGDREFMEPEPHELNPGECGKSIEISLTDEIILGCAEY